MIRDSEIRNLKYLQDNCAIIEIERTKKRILDKNKLYDWSVILGNYIVWGDDNFLKVQSQQMKSVEKFNLIDEYQGYCN